MAVKGNYETKRKKKMIPLTQFKKILILPVRTFLSLGVFFALAISTHAQNLYVSINGDFCGFQCTNSNGSISEYTPAGMVTIASSLARPRGLAFDSSGNLHGFLLRKGNFFTIDVPGATGTEVNGIDSRGDLVGDFTDSRGNGHGFLLSQQQ